MKKFSEMSELELRVEMYFPHTDQELEEIDRELRKYGGRLPLKLQPWGLLYISLPALIFAGVTLLIQLMR